MPIEKTQTRTVAFPDFVEEEVSTLSPLAKRVSQMGVRISKEQAVRIEHPSQLDVQAHQLDLFVADLFDSSFKNDNASMEAPLFSLALKPDHETWRWVSSDKKKWLEVTPSSIGRATMHDKDLLIYITSQIVAAMNNAIRNSTKMPGRRIQFTLHDYLISTGRCTSGVSYSNFEATLDRLAGTRLKTNIAMGNLDYRSSFGLIEGFDYIMESDSNGKRRMVAIVVTISKWLYRSMEENQVLTINKNYFTLRRPLEKKLYEIARKHVGVQPDWIISETTLYEKVGSRASSREFRRMMKEIILSDNIPEYRLAYTESMNHEKQIRFYQKDQKKLSLGYAKRERSIALPKK